MSLLAGRGREAPVITCPDALVVVADDIPASFGQPVVEGKNLAKVVVSCFPGSPDELPIGTSEVECTATDKKGRSDTCTFSATVTGAFVLSVCVTAL